MKPSEPALRVRDVTVRFPGADHPVIERLSLVIEPGEFVTVVGPSGCGKSTLLRVLAGLLQPTSGDVARSGIARDPDRIGFVFQQATLLPWRTAADNLRLPLELGPGRGNASLSPADVSSLLEQVGLSAGDAGKRPHELSGGMQMRLSLARALATQPSLLLLDEPFAAVDDLLRQRLQEDLRRIQQQRSLTTVLVTHNLTEAVFLSDRVIVLAGIPASIRLESRIHAGCERQAEFRGSPEFVESVRRLSESLQLA
jgi:NitT/TauT family transport system ATP-binding protein